MFLKLLAKKLSKNKTNIIYAFLFLFEYKHSNEKLKILNLKIIKVIWRLGLWMIKVGKQIPIFMKKQLSNYESNLFLLLWNRITYYSRNKLFTKLHINACKLC